MAEKKLSAEELAELKAAMKAEILAEMKYDIKAEVKEITSAMDKPLRNVIAESTPDMDEMVTIQLFKDGDKYKDDVQIGVNGKLYTIMRGVPVTVPKYVAKIVEDGMRQDVYAATVSEDAENKFNAAVKNGVF